MKKRNASNPFKYGTIIDDDAFCNRKEEISYLKQQITNAYSTWLFSPRRFGKTSLVEKVFRETDNATCLFLDLYNIKSIDDFCRKYSQLLADKLFDWKDDIRMLTKKFSETFHNLSPSVTFNENGIPSFSLSINSIEKQSDIETILEIPNTLATQNNKRICIAFDEFQEIQRIDPFLINWMRSAFQRHKNVSYIFLGSKQSMMEDIFASARSPFYEFASKMNLNPIPTDELQSFIQNKFNDHQLTITQQTLNSILSKSECQPHFTQYFASVVFDLVRAGMDQNDTQFENYWVQKIIANQVDLFQDIYDQLTNSQRSTLLAIAKLNDEGIFSEQARKRYDLPVSSSLNEVLKALQKKGLIYKTEHHYHFVNPIFREWVIGINT